MIQFFSKPIKLFKIFIATCMMFILVGCEYGDIQGSEESFDRLIGLKVKPEKILALRHGTIDFIGCFIFQFPDSTQNFFDNVPNGLSNHPIPLSYEKEKTFINWKATPVTQEHLHFLNTSLAQVLSIGLDDEQYKFIMELACSDNAFYSISFEGSVSAMSHNVNFYLIDPKRRLFYNLTDTSIVYMP